MDSSMRKKVISFVFVLLALGGVSFQNCGETGHLEITILNGLSDGKTELDPEWIDTSRLVGYWKFDEGASSQGMAILDSSALKHSGVLETNSDGLPKFDNLLVRDGHALYLDGVDDFVQIPEPLDGHLNFGTKSFSYMVSVKVDVSAGSWDMPLWKGGNSANDPGYDIELGINKWAAFVSDGTSLFEVEFGNESEFLGKWVHLAVVVDRAAGQLRGYVNGVLKISRDISSLGSVTTTQNLKLGSSQGDNFFKGLMDDVAIWKTSLSDSEVLTIYQHIKLKYK